MTEEDFARIAEEEWQRVPERFASRIQNLALLIEDEPDRETRTEEGLHEGETLLGLYRGIPATLRGSEYGVGGTLPDTITLYKLPILEEAQEMAEAGKQEADFSACVRTVVRETIWHEIGHYFGFDEDAIHAREDEGTNAFGNT